MDTSNIQTGDMIYYPMRKVGNEYLVTIDLKEYRERLIRNEIRKLLKELE
jgi:hypothetical protein